MATSRPLIVGIAIALTLPVSAATWFVHGTYEPDTDCDTPAGCELDGNPIAGGYMFVNADTSASGLKIYFNGYHDAGQSAQNPNSDILGSRQNPHGARQSHAYLGVWKDCNDDGYIGDAKTALHTYPPAVGGALTSICPTGTMFNTGGWVYEFIWIGAGGMRAGDRNYTTPTSQHWINDTESLVWMDDGKPGAAPIAQCAIRPLPAGTFASTGGLLNPIDCRTGRQVAKAVNAVDGDGSLGLRFEDENYPQRSSSLLNQPLVNLFGNPYAGEDHDTHETGLIEKDSQKGRQPDYDPVHDYDPDNTDSAFHVWDCSDPNANKVENPGEGDDLKVPDPTGGELDNLRDDEDDNAITVTQLSRDGVIVSFPDPAPGVDNPRGSYYDAVNETERGGANVWFGGNIAGNGAENCNPDNSTVVDAYAPGLIESNSNVQNSPLKVSTSEWFSFNTGGQPPRGRQLGGNRAVGDPSDSNATLFAMSPEDELKNNTGGDTGMHLNTTIGQDYQFGADFRGILILRPGWTGAHLTTNHPGSPNPGTTVRADGTPEGGLYFTFYARIGAATLATGAVTPKGNVASIYGHEWCDGAVSGPSVRIAGMDCDRSHWWNPVYGAPMMPRAGPQLIPLGATVGDPYHLRDVDCLDGTLVRGVAARASAADLSERGPCDDASV